VGWTEVVGGGVVGWGCGLKLWVGRWLWGGVVGGSCGLELWAEVVGWGCGLRFEREEGGVWEGEGLG